MKPLASVCLLSSAALLPLPLIRAQESPPAARATAPESRPVDLRIGRPWLPPRPETLTPAMRATMRAFADELRVGAVKPAGRGVKPEEVDALLARFDALGIRRDGSGAVVTDRPTDWKNSKDPRAKTQERMETVDFAQTAVPVFHDLRLAYQRAKSGSPEAARLETPIRLVLEYIAGRDWNASRPDQAWLTVDMYRLNATRAVDDFLGLAHLLESDAMRARLAENWWWMMEGSHLLIESPALTTDSMLNTVPYIMKAMAALPDSPEKWQRLVALRRGLDHSILRRRPNMIMPDGGVTHHGGYHVGYAGYSFTSLVRNLEVLERCGLRSEDSAEIIRRVVLAGVHWAWVNTPDRPAVSLDLRIRLPESTARFGKEGRINWAMTAARLVHAAGGPAEEDNRELAELALAVAPGSVPAALRAAWEQRGFKAVAPAGHLSLPCAGAAVHKRDGWTVVLRGQNRFLRGGEGMPYGAWGQEITQAARYCRGSLLLVDTGTPANPVDSGWVAEGFDRSRVPGTTGPVLGPRDMVSGYIETKAEQGGGCALGGDGLWAFAEGGLRKSCFLVGDRITLVTTGVTTPAGARNRVMTTVFQSAETAPLPLVADGRPLADSGTTRLAGAQAHTVLDGRSRGYYLHAGSDDLVIERGDQSWTCCDVPFFHTDDPNIVIAKDSPRAYVTDRTKRGEPRRRDQYVPGEITGPAKLGYFKPTTHRYSTGGYEHAGTAPERPHAFTLLPRCDADRLAKFAREMESAAPPVRFRTDARAHVFTDGPTGLAGGCLFVGGEIAPALRPGKVMAISRPCTFLERASATALELAVASTDLSRDDPFVIQVAGDWVADAAPADARIAHEPGRTTITLPYRDMTGRNLRLLPR